jgi:hypothetical protein
VEAIQVDSMTFRDLSLIAKAAGMTHSQAVAFLIEDFHRTSGSMDTTRATSSGVPVHATYQGQRVEGVFDPDTGGLTVTSAPLQGKWFRSPSGAAKAVVASLKPGVTPNRSGYDFWFVTSTGKTLASIRSRR